MTRDDLVSKEVYACIEKLITNLEIKNFTINITPGCIKGNYLGIIAKVQVKGADKDDGDVTLNLITKSAPRAEGFRDVVPVQQAYDREIYVYNKVFPEFIKLQNEAGMLKPFKSFAKYYSSIMEDDNEALVLEDMKELGFQQCDRHEPLDFNHILLVMREYGKLHALSFAIRDQKPELFQQLSDNMQESFFASMTSDYMHKTVEFNSERAIKALDPANDKIAYEKFKNFQKNMLNLAEESIKSEAAGEYGVISHGDCWLNNMLFKYGDPSKTDVPTEMCLLDWQLSRLGSPALDLSYFLFTCSSKEVRNEYYKKFIQEYYDSLSSMLRKLGSDPDKLFPFKILQQHLKRFSVFGLYMAITVLYMITSEVEEIPDIYKSTDNEDMVNKLHFESKNAEKYNERIRGVILDFVKYGYEF